MTASAGGIARSGGCGPTAAVFGHLPVSRAVVTLVGQAAGSPPVLMPNMGGSLPLYLFADILQVPIVSVPVVNHDNGQHAANENLRIQNLWDAIETYAVVLARLEPEWRAAEQP